MQKRILIIADSLGCPRKQVTPNETWTEKIIKNRGGYIVYTYCIYGLRSTDIPFDWIYYLKPDIIICQFGICDACRRVCPENMFKMFAKFKGIGKVYQYFASKYHFYLTKFWNNHYTDICTFESLVKKLCAMHEVHIAFIPIAPPGEYLIKKTYKVTSDINSYNSVFLKISRHHNVSLLSVYDGVKSDDIILKEDGHHLNAKGNELVYNAVADFINEQIYLHNL